MTTLRHSPMKLQGTPSLTTRALIFALVASAHMAVLFVWTMRADASHTMQHDMAVTFALAAPVQQSVMPAPHITSNAATTVTDPIAAQSVAAVEQAPVEAVSPQPAAVAAASVVVDTQPDYKAAYLNNPPPGYPMMARRNGLQGRVVLNVEVLANGSSGQVSIQSSSGYAMLDNAALQTVKSWRFVPARHGGQIVDKWFMIPIQFSLKDNQI